MLVYSLVCAKVELWNYRKGDCSDVGITNTERNADADADIRIRKSSKN